MKIYKVCLALLLLPMVQVLDSCWHSSEKVCLTKVTDLKGDGKHVWDLEYDASRRLVRYGDTPISYGNDQITVGEMEWDSKGDHMYHATFRLNKNGTHESNAHCRLMVKGDVVDAWKKTSYRETKDTLFVLSNYYVEGIDNPIREVEAKYVFDTQNRLIEIISAYSDSGANHKCHCFYEYNANIHYDSNLNLQAFLVDREGLDTFFYLLLNLGKRQTQGALPEHIRHCVNQGKAMYVADGLYCLEGDIPTRAEVISLQAELKARLEFEHAHWD
ncbi:MAG: hypothetical protein IKW37_03020 [Bacteroidaceae bacterium]|nr:hypothetical protein [Bacteroidaceae bacterium]